MKFRTRAFRTKLFEQCFRNIRSLLILFFLVVVSVAAVGTFVAVGADTTLQRVTFLTVTAILCVWNLFGFAHFMRVYILEAESKLDSLEASVD